MSADEVGVPTQSATTVLGAVSPPARGERRLVHDDGSAAETIVAYLSERRLLG